MRSVAAPAPLSWLGSSSFFSENVAYHWGILAKGSKGASVRIPSEPLVISVTFSLEKKKKKPPLLGMFSEEVTKRQTARESRAPQGALDERGQDGRHPPTQCSALTWPWAAIIRVEEAILLSENSRFEKSTYSKKNLINSLVCNTGPDMCLIVCKVFL